MLNFDFLDKGLGIVPPAHFVYDFPTKIFLMVFYYYGILWYSITVVTFMSLLLEIVGNMCTVMLRLNAPLE